jgi:pyruvate formate lyase activating enzyme
MDFSARKGIVFNIMRYSTQDGPGLRTTVFLKGCPLSCAWCHNPESQFPGAELVWRQQRCIGCGTCVESCPISAMVMRPESGPIRSDLCNLCGDCAKACPAEAWDLIGREMSVGQVMETVLKDRPFYEESGGGVTFSGGEPLGRLDFLEGLLRYAKKEGLHTAVDTCGAAPWTALERILSLVDIFLYDLKIMDEGEHRRWTGVSNETILENLRMLTSAGSAVVVRVPIIPGITDQDDNIIRIGEFVASLPHIWYISLLSFHETGGGKYGLLGRDNPVSGLRPPDGRRMDELADILRGFGLKVSIGG